MRYEVVSDVWAGDGRVNGVNSTSTITVAQFYGPNSRERAEEYAAWKNSQENPSAPKQSPPFTSGSGG